MKSINKRKESVSEKYLWEKESVSGAKYQWVKIIGGKESVVEKNWGVSG